MSWLCHFGKGWFHYLEENNQDLAEKILPIFVEGNSQEGHGISEFSANKNIYPSYSLIQKAKREC